MRAWVAEVGILWDGKSGDMSGVVRCGGMRVWEFGRLGEGWGRATGEVREEYGWLGGGHPWCGALR